MGAASILKKKIRQLRSKLRKQAQHLSALRRSNDDVFEDNQSEKYQSELRLLQKKLSKLLEIAKQRLQIRSKEKTAEDGEMTNFWQVRNSWGRGWGDRGYAKLLRGKNYAATEYQAEYVIPDIESLNLEALGIHNCA